MKLITRSDFDGLVCAVLLEEIGVIDSYQFVHPKDIQDGKVKVTKNDVLANVPYSPGCGIWFDHHTSETERLEKEGMIEYEGISRSAPSCARVIYDYYGGAEKFNRFDDTGLMAAVDKSDSAAFTAEEILEPRGWVLLSFIMDARTGLGRYRDYRISNLELMMNMIKYCRTMTMDEILDVPDVQERVHRYFAQEKDYVEMITANSRVDQNVIVIDLTHQAEILSGNRFIEYALYPQQNVSIRAIRGHEKDIMVITVGHSIINRTCRTDVGSVMLRYGGGGHRQVGTCQVNVNNAPAAFMDIISELKANG